MLKKLLALLAMLYAAASFAAVDVNTAKQADLDSVKGIGPATSKRILDARKKGEFKNWDDLISRVKGIGSGNAAKFSAEGLTVNGEAYKKAAEAKKEEKKEAKEEKKSTKAESKPGKAEKKDEKAAAAQPAASAASAAKK